MPHAKRHAVRPSGMALCDYWFPSGPPEELQAPGDPVQPVWPIRAVPEPSNSPEEGLSHVTREVCVLWQEYTLPANGGECYGEGVVDCRELSA